MANQRQDSYKNVNAIELKSAKAKKRIVQGGAASGPRRYQQPPRQQFDQDLRGPSNESSDSFDNPGGMGFFNPVGGDGGSQKRDGSLEPLFKSKKQVGKPEKRDQDESYGIINIQNSTQFRNQADLADITSIQ